MNYSIVITTPFRRICHYEFETTAEAKRFIGTLSSILGMEITADVVPTQLLDSYYDA